MFKYNISGYSVEIDKEATMEWYKDYEGWGCDCGSCLNFLEAAKQRKLPKEAAEILSVLGIPPEKPTYVCELWGYDGHEHLYQFDYRIAGKILAEKRKKNESIYCGQETYPHVESDFPEPHFDLIFDMIVPWVLEEPKDK